VAVTYFTAKSCLHIGLVLIFMATWTQPKLQICCICSVHRPVPISVKFNDNKRNYVEMGQILRLGVSVKYINVIGLFPWDRDIYFLHFIALYYVFRLYDSALAIILLKATWLDLILVSWTVQRIRGCFSAIGAVFSVLMYYWHFTSFTYLSLLTSEKCHWIILLSYNYTQHSCLTITAFVHC